MLLLTLSFLVVSSLAEDPNLFTLTVHPTSELLLKWNTKSNRTSFQRRELTENIANKKFKNHAIYQFLQREHFDEDNYIAQELLDSFEKTRHLSRYELRYDATTRRLDQDKIQNSPLLQGLGTHYVTAWVGTPPQRKSVIVDTGSHYTAFPCIGCKKCGEEYHTDKYFDPKKSSTFHTRDCQDCGRSCDKSDSKCYFSQGYSEGSSWRAYQATDQFFLGSNEKSGGKEKNDLDYAIEFMFGCQVSENGLFVTQLADGIMGLSADDATFPKYLHRLKKIDHLSFSMCFDLGDGSSKEGVNAGVITMGGTNPKLNYKDMVYAKNLASKGWFKIHVRNFYLRKGGGNSARFYKDTEHQRLPVSESDINAGKGIIVDSGTTDTYLHKKLDGPFRSTWKKYFGKSFTNDFFSMTEEETDNLPTLLIQISSAYDDNFKLPADHDRNNIVGDLDPSHPNDIIIAIPPQHYIEYSSSKDKYVIRLFFSEHVGGVLGANTMLGHNIHFDWENKRVGFAESSCNLDKEFELAHPLGVHVEEEEVKFEKEDKSEDIADESDSVEPKQEEETVSQEKKEEPVKQVETEENTEKKEVEVVAKHPNIPTISEKSINDNNDEPIDVESSINVKFIATMIGAFSGVLFVGLFIVRKWEERDISSILRSNDQKYSPISQEKGDIYLPEMGDDEEEIIYEKDSNLESIELT